MNLSQKFNHMLGRAEEYFVTRKVRSVPTAYALGITNVCNLRCPLCVTGVNAQDKSLKFMDVDLYKNIIDRIKNHAQLVQLYRWGESLLHKDFVEMLEYANRFDLNTEISSNMSLSGVEDKLEAMVIHRLKTLIVSFDGINQEDYSRYRVKGDFELVLENLRKLKEFKTKHNSKYPIVKLQYLRNKFTTNQFEIIQSKLEEFNADECFQCDMTSMFKDRNRANLLQWFTEEEIKQRKFLDVDVTMQKTVCNYLYNFMIIEQDGSIPACCFSTKKSDDFSFWQSELSLIEMYNSQKFVEARENFQCKSAKNKSYCNDCSVYLSYVRKK